MLWFTSRRASLKVCIQTYMEPMKQMDSGCGNLEPLKAEGPHEFPVASATDIMA